MLYGEWLMRCNLGDRFCRGGDVPAMIGKSDMSVAEEKSWYGAGNDNMAEGFKLAMRRLAATVTIVSTADDEGYHGLAATAVTSLSTEPAAILACINRTASPFEVLLQRKRFAINILHSDNAGLVPIFSGKIKGPERFKHGIWDHLDGVPILTDAQAVIVCAMAQANDFGTHTIVIGMVETIRIRADIDPLVYQDGYLGKVVRLA